MPITRLRWLFFLLLFTTLSNAQPAGDVRVSVLTCGPGDPLYSKFGHTAFRVVDTAGGTDSVYNYGTFDFNAPGFYTSFARGQLDYFLSRSSFRDFLYAYQLENRWIEEQLLDLPPEEARNLAEFLEWNYLPANRFYRYDFLQENCSTKIPEVLKRVLGNAVYFDPSYLQEEASYRELIQSYLRTNSWGSLGIDLALGSVIDRDAGPLGHLFLPDYVYLQLDASTFQGTPLVSKKRQVLDQVQMKEKSGNPLAPGTWITLIFLIGLALSWRAGKFTKPVRGLDPLLFLLTGSCGLLITFLWWFTDHSATRMNFNILWAIPLNLFLLLPHSIFPGGQKAKRYFVLLLLCLLVCCLLLWFTGVQAFHPWLLPLWALLALRYSVLYRYFRP